VEKINNNINQNMMNNRRKFFKMAGISSTGLFLWNFFPKLVFASRQTKNEDKKDRVSIHPLAIRRNRSK